jgi:hypothetical protein
MLYPALSGCIWNSASICSWLAEHGTPAARCSALKLARGITPASDRPRALAWLSAAASAAMVGVRKSCAVGTSHPTTLRTAIITLLACRSMRASAAGVHAMREGRGCRRNTREGCQPASRAAQRDSRKARGTCKELPPTAKKSSAVLMRSRPSICCHTACRRASSSLAGATYCAASWLPQAGGGSALRSIFSLGSSGRRAIGTTTEGTMCAGSRSRSPAASAADASSAGVT